MYKIVPVEEIPIGEDINIDNHEEILDLYNILIKFAISNDYPLGLSAVQLGIPKKFFIARCSIPDIIGHAGLEYVGYANCTYTSTKDNILEIMSTEGCLSIPGLLYDVKRFVHIHMIGYMMTIDPISLAVEMIQINTDIKNQLISVILQHEIDHQHGILISDLGTELEAKVIK